MSDTIIGLTGGVASGKSEATCWFEQLGIFVADADVAAREALAFGSDGLAEVTSAFGNEILQPDGNLDRPAMRRRIFADPEARKRLEAIVHPQVRAMLRTQCEQASSPYAIAAIPLLAEGGGRVAYPWLDRILLIDVPAHIQEARVMQRDNVDAALAREMIAAQATREQRLAIADDIIVNTGTVQELRTHVEAMHHRYLALAHGSNNEAG